MKNLIIKVCLWLLKKLNYINDKANDFEDKITELKRQLEKIMDRVNEYEVTIANQENALAKKETLILKFKETEAQRKADIKDKAARAVAAVKAPRQSSMGEKPKRKKS